MLVAEIWRPEVKMPWLKPLKNSIEEQPVEGFLFRQGNEEKKIHITQTSLHEPRLAQESKRTGICQQPFSDRELYQ